MGFCTGCCNLNQNNCHEALLYSLCCLAAMFLLSVLLGLVNVILSQISHDLPMVGELCCHYVLMRISCFPSVCSTCSLSHLRLPKYDCPVAHFRHHSAPVLKLVSIKLLGCLCVTEMLRWYCYMYGVSWVLSPCE